MTYGTTLGVDGQDVTCQHDGMNFSAEHATWVHLDMARAHKNIRIAHERDRDGSAMLAGIHRTLAGQAVRLAYAWIGGPDSPAAVLVLAEWHAANE